MPTDRRVALAALGAGVVAGYFTMRAQSINLPAPPGFFLNFNGRRVHYTDSGAGRPLMFLHDNPGSTFDWQPIISLLPQSYEAIAIDRPGMGFSDPLPPTMRPGLPTFAATFQNIITELKIERPIVVGLGYGGGAALTFAALNPGVLAGLVIISSVGYSTGTEATEERYKFLSRPLIKDLAGALMYMLVKERITADIHKAFAPDENRIVASDLKRSIALYSRPDTLVVAEKVAHTLWADERVLQTQLHTITTPTLIIHGAEDQVILLAAAERLHAAIPDSQLEIIAGAGHALSYTHAPELAYLIDTFAQKYV